MAGTIRINSPATIGIPGETYAATSEPGDLHFGAINIWVQATEPPDFITPSNDIYFGAINVFVQAGEAPDAAAFAMDSEGVVAPPVSIGNGRPRHYLPPRRIVELVMRANEAPDVCRMLIELDWTRDDEDILLLAMTEAA